MSPVTLDEALRILAETEMVRVDAVHHILPGRRPILEHENLMTGIHGRLTVVLDGRRLWFVEEWADPFTLARRVDRVCFELSAERVRR